MEDKHLMERCLNGEKEVYELIVKKYQSMVIALAMSITASIDDAKDIAQESFVRAYLKLSKFNSDLNFKSWIMRITYNCSIDHVRKRKSFLKYFNFKIDQGLNDEMKKYKLVSDSEIFSPHMKKLKPREALRRKVSGEVLMEAVCDVYGRVVEVKILRGKLLLNSSAVNAVKQWVYEPYLINKVAKPVKFTVIMKYRLDGGKKKRIKKIPPIKLVTNVPNIWPTRGYLTWVFGERVDKKTKKKFFHKGVDIVAKEKSNIIAPANGIVTFAALKGKHGNLIIIDHQNNYISKYAHLYSMKVKKGDKVKRGDLIGLVGNTGISSGPHLHWEVHYKGKPVNPLDLLKE